LLESDFVECNGDSVGCASVNSFEKTNIDRKFSLISEHWRPKVAAELNGQEVKLVKFKGEFVWHHHDNEDELFLVWRGSFRIEFRDCAVELHEGECLVVPRGVEHRTVADEEVEVLIFEPAATRNTGNILDDRFTSANGVKI
jgi:mannose-6-phosphate isomerase-like protein (cupin superfamily)